MKNIFCKNIFSNSTPDFKLTNSKTENLKFVKLCISKYYRRSISDLTSIKLLCGLNINSENFLVKCESKEFLVKLIKKDIFKYKQKFVILESILSNRNLPIANNIYNDFQSVVTIKDTKLIHITEYIKGNYFLGGIDDIEKVTKSILKLTNNCINLKVNNLDSAPTLPNNPIEILELILSKKLNFNILDENAGLKILYENSEYIFKNIHFVQGYSYKPKIIAPFHIDLHPHNFIINKEKAYIIDLDSICNLDLNISIGFAYFKLLRQDIANKSHTRKSKDIFITSFNSLKHYKTNDDVYFCTKKEILRRIFVILTEIIQNGHSRWENVLEIQISSLLELDHIYQKNK